MLVGMALRPAVNAQQEDNFFEDGYYLPDYGSSIFVELKDDSSVIETRGVIPEITDDFDKSHVCVTHGIYISQNFDYIK